MLPLFLYRHAGANRVSDKDRFDEAEPVIAVRERLGIHIPRRHAHGHAEDQRAVRDALTKCLGPAPLGIHMVRIIVSGLSGVRDDVRFRNRTPQRLACCAYLVVFKKLASDHR